MTSIFSSGHTKLYKYREMYEWHFWKFLEKYYLIVTAVCWLYKVQISQLPYFELDVVTNLSRSHKLN